ncbi:cytochrome c [Hydrogenophaga sp.]|uniref:SorU family sulfite dehydrogenase c-type cytochrome subunit n=1 Tax=Hydrogenophaga sp. TaxID=1904254 RepID=UPI0035AE9C3B
MSAPSLQLENGLPCRPASVALAALVAFAAPPVWSEEETVQLKVGRALFTQNAVPACAVCHTLKDAGAQGLVGPVLDELKPDAARVATALRNGIGQMPSYKGRLDESQIAALAAYVAKASGASG